MTFRGICSRCVGGRRRPPFRSSDESDLQVASAKPCSYSIGWIGISGLIRAITIRSKGISKLIGAKARMRALRRRQGSLRLCMTQKHVGVR